MEISPVLLSKMLLISFFFGMQAGVIFDIGRALRTLLFGEVKSKGVKKICSKISRSSNQKIEKNKNKIEVICEYIVVFFYDIFWVAYSIFSLAIINYSYNNGGIRFFTVIGVVAGFAIYYFTISRLVIFLTELAVFLLRYTFFAFLNALSIPFLKIYNNLVKKIKKRCEKFRFRIEKKVKKVYNVSEIVCKNEDDNNQSSVVKISVRKNQEKGNAQNERE